MSKELETQPYRLFKESLDRIINMPDNIKNELVEIFEKKRLEKQNAEEQEKEEEQVVQPEEVQPQEEQPEEEPVVQQEEVQQEEVQPEEDKNSLFDRFFSQSQSLQPEQKPVLNPPQHKCKIRDW